MSESGVNASRVDASRVDGSRVDAFPVDEARGDEPRADRLLVDEPDGRDVAARRVGAIPLSTGDDLVEALRGRVAETARDHPGVARLEPTLSSAVQGLRRGGALDGIQLDVHGRVADLDVNLATRADHQARATALDLHEQLVALVVDHGLVPGTIEISILTVTEPGV